LIRDALRTPHSRFAYVAPTYKQAKNVAWDFLKYYSRPIPGIKINESELRIDYPNLSRITLFGADNPDALRGLGLWGVVFDEYSQQPSNIFTEIIRPALSDHHGYAIWIGTPKGKNDFYRLYDFSIKDDKWSGIFLTVDDTKLIATEELEDARKIMDEDEFNQEFYCSFEAAIKGAYYSKQIQKARDENRITSVPYETALKVDTWWDIGVGDSTAIWFVQTTGNDIRLIDYLESSGEGLNYYIKKLQEKDYIYGNHYAPHDIEVREFSTGKSRIETAQRLGINFRVVPKLSIDDGINAVRNIFNKCYFDKDKCAIGLDYLAQYHREWDDKMGEFKARPCHDFTSHCADSFRYGAIVYQRPLTEREEEVEQRQFNNKMSSVDRRRVI